ncbi:MAG: hypothetical protein ACI4M3_01825, partial [Acutalibacteraceae bacterium]
MTLRDYEEKYYGNLERGEAKRDGVYRAINAALEQQDWRNALELYYEFLHQDVFYCDNFQSTIMFPKYLALFEEHPELQKDFAYDMMWSYKWIIQNFYEFWQIPKEQIVSIYQQYYDFCTRFGYSKRTYYDKLWTLLYIHGLEDSFNVGSAKDCYAEMQRCPKDSMDDCAACELNNDVDYILSVEKDIDKALKKAYPILAGKKSCAEIPHITYAMFAVAYFEKGNFTEAKKYTDLCWHLVNREMGDEPTMISTKSDCLLVYAYTNPTVGMKIFKKTFRFCPSLRNGKYCFDFYRSAYHLFLQLEKQGQKTIHLAFPFKDNPLYNNKGIYNVSDIKDFLYEQAKFYADKFDARNGNSKFNDTLAETYDFDYATFKAEEDFQVPVLNYIRDCMDEDGTLPLNFSLPKSDIISSKDESDPQKKPVYFADGALDGIRLFHTQPEYIEVDEELKGFIQMANEGRVRSAASKIEKYFRRTGIRMLTLIDNLQKYISDNSENLSVENIYNLAIELTVKAKHKETVKCGLGMLELFSYFNDALKEAIMDLALSDEFTFYCLFVMANWEDSNDCIFKIAQKVHGWGRIHAVHHLKPTSDEIKEWLATEGYKNIVLEDYSVRECFVKSGMPEKLKAGLTQEELTPVGEFLEKLLVQGPVGDIYELENAEEIIADYLHNAEVLEQSDRDKEIVAKLTN